MTADLTNSFSALYSIFDGQFYQYGADGSLTALTNFSLGGMTVNSSSAALPGMSANSSGTTIPLALITNATINVATITIANIATANVGNETVGNLQATTINASSVTCNTLTVIGNSISLNVISANSQTLGISNASTNGYSSIPNGLLMQWGIVAANSTAKNVTFPTAFPINCFSIVISGADASTFSVSAQIVNNTTANVKTSNATTANYFWHAVGK